MIKRKYADIFTNSLRIIINKWFMEQINSYKSQMNFVGKTKNKVFLV